MLPGFFMRPAKRAQSRGTRSLLGRSLLRMPASLSGMARLLNPIGIHMRLRLFAERVAIGRRVCVRLRQRDPGADQGEPD